VVTAEGARFENLVASHVLKWVEFPIDTEGRPLELHYLRDVDGREVDFVVVERGKPIALIECKLGDDAVSPGLRHLKARFPDVVAWQLSARGVRDYVRGEGVRVAPAARLLRELV
jgi:predicted AAA+ superfamily ATPase